MSLEEILQTILEGMVRLTQAIFENPLKIVLFVICVLIIPSVLFFYFLIGGEALKSTGHETAGSFIIGLLTWFGNVTTSIGMALIKPAICLFVMISIGIALYNSITK
ncbi:MAG: hypothetical protein KKE93_01590 [Nanoarchaeota archaeon]|nr:hypothetical protein [Nanoarchaeota archaeon]